MATLPNVENAEIAREKLTDYLLSLTHRDGRGKAVFFRAFGFSPDDWETLAEALRRHAAQNAVIKMEETPFGTRYVVEGPIHAPDGRTPNVRLVWFMGKDETNPRLATAYPLPADTEPGDTPERTQG
jgi:hypothetical protein